MEAFVISPGCLEQEFSLLVRIGGKSILYNAPPGAQRVLSGSNFVKFEAADQIILMDSTPEALEGLIGMMCTTNAHGMTTAGVKVTVFHRCQPIVEHFNRFTKDIIFDGLLIEILQSVHHYKDFSLRFVPMGGSYITIFETKLVVKKEDRSKIKQLNLNRLQSKELYLQGFLNIGDETIKLDDFRLQELHSGNIAIVPRLANYANVGQILQHFIKPNAVNFVFTPCLIEDLTHCREYLTYQNKCCRFYPIADFSAYYYQQTKRILGGKGNIDCEGVFIQCFPVFKEDNELHLSHSVDFLNSRIQEKEYVEIKHPELEGENSLVTLGTGACVPSKYNNVSGNYVNGKILVDAGEGSLEELSFYYKCFDLDVIDRIPADFAILITHEHGDHFFGVCSFLSVYHAKFGKYPQIIANPIVFSYIKILLNVDLRNSEKLGYIEEIPVTHGEYSTAFLIQQNSSFLYISGDCKPQPIEACENLTILHEATFREQDTHEALSRNHSTTSEAAELIQQVNAVGILTHFSQRYPRDAIDFENCWKAVDLFDFKW